LRTISFVIQASRWAIRDRKTRRKTMFVLLVLALLFLFSGSTFLQSALDPREHSGRFILFWAICAWLTLAAILLAVFDLLIVKLEGRQNERTLREKFLRSANQDSPRSTTSE
jgi:protein-S-isoprenylcysteine O-methyltransferase Ste14